MGYIFNYYKNRKKRILYQREYDKNHRDKKRAYDKKRREEMGQNIKRVIQNYSRVHYFDLLIKRYKGCQLCNSIDKLQIHHKRYTKKLKDCMLLCKECHKKIHLKYKP